MSLLLRISAIRALEAAYSAQRQLMERAGLAVAECAGDLLKQAEQAEPVTLILAGVGNNGGDAYVCARHLRSRGHTVWLASIDPLATLPPDAAAARTAWLVAGGKIHADFSPGQNFALAIDGLLGIGASRPVEDKMKAWIERFNALPCARLALDVPSGLDADTGQVKGCAIVATHTITFLADKPGLHTLDGPDHAGIILCRDLDASDADVFAQHAADCGNLVERSHFADVLKSRQSNSHKGSFGSVAIVGGSAGMAGAALLAGRAALYLGAGRVYIGMLERLAVDCDQPELMLRAVPGAIAEADAIGIGPGLGTDEEAFHAVQLAIGTDKPLALDADALNLLAEHSVLASRLVERTAPTLLTPHPAEAARLAGKTTEEIQQDRVASARALAQQFHAAVVLKGNGSVIALPDGRWFINGNGNAGLATGGTGDVLLGFVATLLAQSCSAETALLAAVHVHGAAADALVEQGVGMVGMSASEIIPAARQCWNSWL